MTTIGRARLNQFSLVGHCGGDDARGWSGDGGVGHGLLQRRHLCERDVDARACSRHVFAPGAGLDASDAFLSNADAFT